MEGQVKWTLSYLYLQKLQESIAGIAKELTLPSQSSCSCQGLPHLNEAATYQVIGAQTSGRPELNKGSQKKCWDWPTS